MHGLNGSMWLLPEVRRRRSAAECRTSGPWSMVGHDVVVGDR